MLAFGVQVSECSDAGEESKGSDETRPGIEVAAERVALRTRY